MNNKCYTLLISQKTSGILDVMCIFTIRITTVVPITLNKKNCSKRHLKVENSKKLFET